jgi:aryl-alcohol dehydrogenase-like predicted oxidoreductase
LINLEISMSDLRQACPRRPYGGTNTALPKTVPIVALGCSSFSTFYHPRDSDGGTSDNAPGEAQQLTRDTITKDHPQVQLWIRTIRHAILDCGINLLDTAPWYGHGVSEIVVGYALEDIIASDEAIKKDDADSSANKKVARANLIVNTKVGRYEANPADMFDFSHDRTIESVQTSLDRLKCGGYVDVIQSHDPEFSPSIQLLLDETIPALLEVKSRGWAKAIGITGYPIEIQKEILVRSAVRKGKSYEPPTFVFDQALTYCHANLHDMSLMIAPPPPSPLVFEPPSAVSLTSDADKTWVASNQTTLLRDTSDGSSTIGTGEKGASASTFGADNLIGIGEEDELQEMSFSDFCSSKGIALMAAAPLSMGLLTQAGPPAWHPASDELKEACRNAEYICREEFDVDIASLAILFALAQQEIPCTLLGMKSIEEVDRAMELAQRFAGLDPSLSTEEVLLSILTEEEAEALATVLDDEYGPFAQIWQDGDFSWDGFQEAAKHWDKVEGGREVAEAKMRVRK